MKTSNLKKYLALGLTVAGAAFTPNLHADVTLLLSGGSASSSVLLERAGNLYAGGSYTVTYLTDPNGATNTIATFVGTLAPPYDTLGTVTFGIDVYAGAVGGLRDLQSQSAEPTAPAGGLISGSAIPNIVDSSARPDYVGIDGSQFNESEVYIVPYVFIKNTNAASSTAGITNLTQLQAQALESSGAVLPATFFGGNSTNVIYWVGRNKDSAVRTEIDLNINSIGFQTYTTNGLGQVVQDTTGLDLEGQVDPGQSSGSVEQAVVSYITNSIGEVAVQNAKNVGVLSYNGVAYSTNSVLNGTYQLWNPEYYYTSIAHPLDANQTTVFTLFYNSITHSAYWSNSNFKGKFIPTPWVNQNLIRNGDGAIIKPAAGYTTY